MIDLREDLTYVLKSHREQHKAADGTVRHGNPREDAVTWIYALPTADDILGARAAAVRFARSEAATEEERKAAKADTEEFLLQLLTRTLRDVGGLFRGGQPCPFPAGEPVDVRRDWVGRLPYRWFAELGGAVQEEGDLTAEDE